MSNFTNLIFLLLIHLLAPVASQPDLSLHVTDDVTFNCTMAGFRGTFHSLHSLKIIQLNVPRKVSVLATVSQRSGPRTTATFRDKHPLFHTTWRVTSVSANDSWLGLTIISFDSEGDGQYACQINYFENAGDRLSVWESHDLSVAVAGGEKLKTQKVEGFSVTPQRGVHAVCSDGGDVNDVTTIVISDGRRRANYSSEGITEVGLVNAIFHPENASLEAHLLDARCGDSAEFRCTVVTTSGSTLQSSPQRLPADGCPPVTHSTTSGVTTSAGVNSTEPGAGGEGRTTGHPHQDSQLHTGAITGIVLGATALAIISIVLLTVVLVWQYRKRRRMGEGVNRSDRQNDARSRDGYSLVGDNDGGGGSPDSREETGGRCGGSPISNGRDDTHGVGGGSPKSSTSGDSFHSAQAELSDQEGKGEAYSSTMESASTPPEEPECEEDIDLRQSSPKP